MMYDDVIVPRLECFDYIDIDLFCIEDLQINKCKYDVNVHLAAELGTV